MIMAILLLLVAVMVSCVVLTAAVTSIKHVRNDRENQQAYLTVGSAAELMRNVLVQERYAVEETTTGGTTNVQVTEADGDFAALINAAVEAALDGMPYSATFTITGSDMDPVTADFTMDAEENISIVFSLDEETGYAMELKLAPVVDVSTVYTSSGTGARKQTATIVTTTYSWEARDITKAEGAA